MNQGIHDFFDDKNPEESISYSHDSLPDQKHYLVKALEKNVRDCEHQLAESRKKIKHLGDIEFIAKRIVAIKNIYHELEDRREAEKSMEELFKEIEKIELVLMGPSSPDGYEIYKKSSYQE